MKNLVLFCIGTLMLAQSGMANEEITARRARFLVSNAELTASYIDENHERLLGVDGGSVVVEHSKRLIRLVLWRNSNCPEGALCAAMVQPPVIIELPLQNTYRDGCGVLVYTAERDQRPADGMYQQIIVRDNTDITCRTFRFMPVADTEVVYRSITPGFGSPVVEAISRFEGEALVRTSYIN